MWGDVLAMKGRNRVAYGLSCGPMPGGVQRHRRVTGCPHAHEGGYCMDSTGAAGIRYQREGGGEGGRSWP